MASLGHEGTVLTQHEFQQLAVPVTLTDVIHNSSKHKCCISSYVHLPCIPVLLYASGTLPNSIHPDPNFLHISVSTYLFDHSSNVITSVVTCTTAGGEKESGENDPVV